MDELGGRQAAQRFDPPGVAAGIHEELEARPALVLGVVVAAFDGGLLDGAVHPLDLPVGPRVVPLGEPVLSARPIASTIVISAGLNPAPAASWRVQDQGQVSVTCASGAWGRLLPLADRRQFRPGAPA